MTPEGTLARLQEGYKLQSQGRLTEAERAYHDVLQADPGNEHALNLLGAVCVNSGRPTEALAYIRRAEHINAIDPDLQANLGLALKDTGDLEGAKAAFEESLRLRPQHPKTMNNLGNVLAALRRTNEAVALFRRALYIAPDYAECLSNLAAALLHRRQYAHALQAAERAIEIRPELAEAHNNRGEALAKLNRHPEAAASYRQAIALRADYEVARINLTAALKETGALVEARRLLEQVLERDPMNSLALNNLGTLLEQLGQGGDAKACFRRAVASAPSYANAWYQLAHLDAAELSADDITSIEGLLHDRKTPAEDRSALAFALACVFEYRGDVDRHFNYLSLGQDIKRREAIYDRQRVADYHRALRQAFPAPIRVSGDHGAIGPQPVFVVGMPRSGTSLTEQILATHPEVLGAGELGLMEETIREAQRLSGQDFPNAIGELDGAQLRELGDYYLTGLIRRAGKARYIVDKTPMNFQYLGFIAAILPNARFIHCTREPIDNCWSIYKLPFESVHSYAHDQESLGDYYVQYRELMAHWLRLYATRILDMRYESTIADFTQQSRRMTDFLGLSYEPEMRDFHRTERIVKTPSASQVRRPLYATSVGAWRPYVDKLRPLIAALAPVLHLEA